MLLYSNKRGGQCRRARVPRHMHGAQTGHYNSHSTKVHLTSHLGRSSGQADCVAGSLRNGRILFLLQPCHPTQQISEEPTESKYIGKRNRGRLCESLLASLWFVVTDLLSIKSWHGITVILNQESSMG